MNRANKAILQLALSLYNEALMHRRKRLISAAEFTTSVQRRFLEVARMTQDSRVRIFLEWMATEAALFNLGRIEQFADFVEAILEEE